MEWRSGYCIEVRMVGRRILFAANQEGYLSLAGLCAVLAQPDMPDGDHIHLDRYCPLEDDSIDGFVLCRMKGDDGLGEQTAEGGALRFDGPHGFSPGPFFESWTQHHSLSDLDTMNACVSYSVWDDWGEPPYYGFVGAGLSIVFSEDTFFMWGDTDGLLALASAFVTMAQPSTKEGTVLTVGIPEHQNPDSICEVELKLVSVWPQWGVTRSDGPWPEFEDTAVLPDGWPVRQGQRNAAE